MYNMFHMSVHVCVMCAICFIHVYMCVICLYMHMHTCVLCVLSMHVHVCIYTSVCVSVCGMGNDMARKQLPQKTLTFILLFISSFTYVCMYCIGVHT